MCEDAPCCGCCGPEPFEWEGPDPEYLPDPPEYIEWDD